MQLSPESSRKLTGKATLFWMKMSDLLMRVGRRFVLQGGDCGNSDITLAAWPASVPEHSFAMPM